MSLQLTENGPRIFFPRPYTEERSRSSSLESLHLRRSFEATSPRATASPHYAYRSLSMNRDGSGRSGEPRSSPVPRSVTRSSFPSQNATGETPREGTPVVDLTQSPPSQPASLSRQVSLSPSPSISTISISSSSPQPSVMEPRLRQLRPGGTLYAEERRRHPGTPARPHRREGGAKRQRLDESSQNRNQPSQTSSSSINPFARLHETPQSEATDFGYISRDVVEPDSVDLTGVDGPAELAKALSKQREDAVKAQMDAAKQEGEGGRTTLTSYKCPVCMDTPEDATVTVCGHLFCHKCIVDTLKFSEEQRSEHANGKVKGTCPVCRKPIWRNDSGKGRELVPLELKLITKAQFSAMNDEKGKGRATLKRSRPASISGSETMDEA